jgi:hypothetical protein
MIIFSSQGATLLPNVAYYNPSGPTHSLTLRRLEMILSLSEVVESSVTRTLFFAYRFNGIDSKIVHIFTDVPYDGGSSNKNGLQAEEISRPRGRISSPRGEGPDRLTQ